MRIASKVAYALYLTPVFALAAASDPGKLTGVKLFVSNIIAFMNGTLVPFIFALGFLVFLWGMFKTFILGGANEEKQREGKQLILYTVIGFVLMISLWGIVKLIAAGIGLDDSGPVMPNILPDFLKLN